MSLLNRIHRIIRSNVRSRFPDPKTAASETPAGGRPYDQGEAKREYREGSKAINPQIAEYYANLETPYGADLETVRRSWKRLLQQYHPDLHGADPEKQQIANELVQQLNRAYREVEAYLQGKSNP